MSAGAPTKPSFSPARKWGMGFNAVLGALMVLAVVVMVNYLSGRYSRRFYLSTRTRVELSSRTLNLLRALTNRVQITLYYTRDEPLYSEIAELLKEYHSQDPRITVNMVDYYRDPGAVPDLKAKYNLGASTNKNLVIFDCEGRTKIVDGNALVQYTYEAVPNPTEREFRKKPVAFKGEMLFTAALLAVTNPKPLQACYLVDHGEHRMNEAGDEGYADFIGILRQNYISVTPLTLVGTNTVPLDCNLLIIAGPADPFPQNELDQIEHYLNEGGRLFVLFNVSSITRPTGLEKILAEWGVQVGTNVVKDPDNTTSTAGSDVVVSTFADHPVVNPLIGRRLRLVLPREIRRTEPGTQAAETLKIEEVAFSGPRSYLQGGPASQKPHARPLMVTVEKSALKGVVPERGTTRILAVGDSIFLDNQLMDLDYDAPNRDFVGYAANWLLDRTMLLEGIGPRPVTEYRLMMTKSQLQTLQWILLAAIPGGILLFGGLVWLRRRS